MELIELTGSDKKPLADFMHEPEFNLLAKPGCQWCGCKVAFDDPGIEVNSVLEFVLCAEHSSAKGGETRIMVSGDEMDLMRHAA